MSHTSRTLRAWTAVLRQRRGTRTLALSERPRIYQSTPIGVISRVGLARVIDMRGNRNPARALRTPGAP